MLGALFGLAILMFPIAGVVLATKRPDNAIGWLMLAIGVGWAIGLGTAYAQYGLILKPGSLPLANYVAAVSSAFWVPPICLMGSFLLLLFPDGHLLTPRWRWVARLAGFVIVFGTTMMILSPGKMGDTGFPDTVNPLGISSLSTVIHAATLTVVLVPVVILLSAVSLVLRFRRSRGVERLQMKWLVWAAAFVAVSYWSGDGAEPAGLARIQHSAVARARPGRIAQHLRADTDRDRVRRAPLPAVRDRRDHPAHGRLRGADRLSGGRCTSPGSHSSERPHGRPPGSPARSP